MGLFRRVIGRARRASITLTPAEARFFIVAVVVFVAVRIAITWLPSVFQTELDALANWAGLGAAVACAGQSVASRC